jgi:coiled-coil domain-containing protein 55
MLQHERDEEGEEYADKEKFVTTAYKRQMKEVKLAEEEEKAREGASIPYRDSQVIARVLTDSSCISVLAAKERASQKGPGMTAFYRNMLDADEEKHAAAVAASSKSATKPNQGPSLAIRPPDASDNTSDSKSPATFDDTAEEDPFIRRERQRMEMERAMMTAASASVPVVERLPATASTEEERIEINDEGAIVDKRVLLKAGLNITKKPVLPKDGPGDIKRPEVHVPLKSRAVGTDASYEARMARERRRLADQMKDEQERIERERLTRQREVEETAKKRRAGGDDGEGDAKRRAARERFEARKRAKLEQPEADGS